jgi:hypothetical protein
MPTKDWFVEGFGAAVADLRQKLVEEPWYGRSLATPGEQPSLDEALSWAQESPPPELELPEAPVVFWDIPPDVDHDH